MWAIRGEELPAGAGLRFVVERGGAAASRAAVLEGWRGDPAFRALFNEALAGAPYGAFRWETPPVSRGTAGRAFEFVLLDAPGLARKADRRAFAGHFAGRADVVTFANLSGDATLIVPEPVAADPAYGHLAAFGRLAPEDQRHLFWAAVGDALAARLDDRPVWLSTAGAGVAWLHARLDDRPKYYGHAPYRALA